MGSRREAPGLLERQSFDLVLMTFKGPQSSFVFLKVIYEKR
jgi:hypothetical protein